MRPPARRQWKSRFDYLAKIIEAENLKVTKPERAWLLREMALYLAQQFITRENFEEFASDVHKLKPK
jgi:hypothetical protein